MLIYVPTTSLTYTLTQVGFTDQTAVMMLALCNCVAMVFAAMVSFVLCVPLQVACSLVNHLAVSRLLCVFCQNTGQQLLQISRLETTYFDSEGRGGAYRKKRFVCIQSCMHTMRTVILP